MNRPSALTTPAEADHVTSELWALQTIAANCWDEPEEMFALAGETATCTGAVAIRERLTLIAIVLSPRASPDLSATVSMNLYEPASFGTPEIDPEVGLTLSPGGTFPVLAVKT
jgi:hypothetical protein